MYRAPPNLERQWSPDWRGGDRAWERAHEGGWVPKRAANYGGRSGPSRMRPRPTRATITPVDITCLSSSPHDSSLKRTAGRFRSFSRPGSRCRLSDSGSLCASDRRRTARRPGPAARRACGGARRPPTFGRNGRCVQSRTRGARSHWQRTGRSRPEGHRRPPPHLEAGAPSGPAGRRGRWRGAPTAATAGGRGHTGGSQRALAALSLSHTTKRGISGHPVDGGTAFRG